jgi:hypothetical protein
MKKIGLICLVVVMALGAFGVAGALWWDWLYIDGIVQTGSIGAQWSIEDDYDDESKDVSFIDAYLVEPDVMFIDIINAYPSVTYTVEWNIECTGSVPIHFDRPFISTTLPAGATLTFTDMAGVPIDWSQVQLHQGDVMYGMLTVHLDNDALQNTSYWFGITLDYGQYNEFPV